MSDRTDLDLSVVWKALEQFVPSERYYGEKGALAACERVTARLRETEEALRRDLNRYGHHDHNCDCRPGDVYDDDIDCSCGFNRALKTALGAGDDG